jgi:hypothetical protein
VALLVRSYNVTITNMHGFSRNTGHEGRDHLAGPLIVLLPAPSSLHSNLLSGSLSLMLSEMGAPAHYVYDTEVGE